MTKEIILDTSDEAAKPHVIDGWVSRNGHFYRDESAARYDGCTHRACGYCGEPADKAWTACRSCRSKKDIEKYEALPKAKWDGESMIYSEAYDKYFSGPDEALEFLAEDEDTEGKAIADLQLLICEPQYAREIDCNDYLQDVLAEDQYAPEYVEAAFEELNAKIRAWRKEKAALSWYPCKTALLIEEAN